jgi:addiction module HigA family antidote
MRDLDDTHPGEVLLEQFLIPQGISGHRLARELGVPWSEIDDLVHGRRRMDRETALRLASYFGNSARFWLEPGPRLTARA